MDRETALDSVAAVVVCTLTPYVALSYHGSWRLAALVVGDAAALCWIAYHVYAGYGDAADEAAASDR